MIAWAVRSLVVAIAKEGEPAQPRHRQATRLTPGTLSLLFQTLHAKLPQGVYCPWQCAMPAQHLRISGQAQHDTSPRKNLVTSKSPVGDISVVTLIRTDTTLDHSQKAEKVWIHFPGAVFFKMRLKNKIRAKRIPTVFLSRERAKKKAAMDIYHSYAANIHPHGVSHWTSLSTKIPKVTLMRPIHGNL